MKGMRCWRCGNKETDTMRSVLVAVPQSNGEWEEFRRNVCKNCFNEFPSLIKQSDKDVK